MPDLAPQAETIENGKACIDFIATRTVAAVKKAFGQAATTDARSDAAALARARGRHPARQPEASIVGLQTARSRTAAWPVVKVGGLPARGLRGGWP